MKKILPIFSAALFLFVVLPGVASAAPINLNDVISTSTAKGSPLGDCVGPDKKHIQTTKEACIALNQAWGKGNGTFSAGTPTPSSPAATLTVAITTAATTNAPTGDCVGADGKHFQATKAVCETFNQAWGKKDGFAGVGTSAPVPAPTTLPEAIAVATANNSPLVDCTGPDKKHFQAAREVCLTLNKSWGKTDGVNEQSVAAAVVTSAASSGAPAGDCEGPDKKHIKTTKEACDALNHAWGRAAAPFSGPVSTSVTGGGSSSGTTGGGTGGSGSSSSAGGTSSGSSKSSGGSSAGKSSGSAPAGSSVTSGNSSGGSSASSNSDSGKGKKDDKKDDKKGKK